MEKIRIRKKRKKRKKKYTGEMIGYGSFTERFFIAFIIVSSSHIRKGIRFIHRLALEM